MGATVTTFCNATNIVLYTSLSVLFPYYSTDQLQPGRCVSYTVGQFWFTATAEIYTDLLQYGVQYGDLYFPVSQTQAAGLLYGLPKISYETVQFVNMTPNEADQVMKGPYDIIGSHKESISWAYVENHRKLSVKIMGFYTNRNKKITIKGGPKGAVYKDNPAFPGKQIAIVSAYSKFLEMTVS